MTITLKWYESHSVVSNSLWPHGLYSPLNSLGQDPGVGSLSLLQQITDPEIELGSPAFQADSLPTELSGKSDFNTNQAL